MLKGLQWLSVLALLSVPFLCGPARTAVAAPVEPPEVTVVAIEAGHYHTVALMSDGTVMAWGENMVGQLGEGTTPTGSMMDNDAYPYAIPVQEKVNGVLRPLTGVVAISAGAQYSLALKEDGTVWSWGFGYSGELGRGQQWISTAAEIVPNLTGIVQVAAADMHALALTADGKVWAWGDNQMGQAGIGPATEATKFLYNPVQTKKSPAEYLTNVKQIAANGSHSVALTNDGIVISWGYNGRYQLGDGTLTSRNYPIPVLEHGTANAPLANIEQIAAGRYHNVAIDKDGRLWTWGSNENGQLGLGHTNFSVTRASMIPGLPQTRFKAIAAGGFHSAAIQDDGTVWTWGRNSKGELGRSNGNDSSPGQVLTAEDGTFPTDICAASAGEEHTVLLGCDGTLWAVGGNSMRGEIIGQLGGNRTEMGITKFVQVTIANLAETVWNDPTVVAGQSGEVSLQLAFADTAREKTRYPLKSGTDNVTMETDDPTMLGPVTYTGSGTFAAPFRGETAGTYTVTAIVNGLNVPVVATVNVVAAAPDAGRSSLTASPGFAVADGTSAVTLTLRLKDAFGNGIDIEEDAVAFTSTLGEIGPVSKQSDNGTVTYTAELTSTVTGRATIGVEVDGTPLGMNAEVDFKSGAPDSSRFVLTAAPASLPADGSSAATVTLQLFDAQGNALTESGGAVDFVTDLGRLSSVTESVYGEYSATLTSDEPGLATIGAERDGQLIARTATVRWLPLQTDVSFAKPRYNVTEGRSVQTRVNVSYSDGSVVDVTSASAWHVRDAAIASIDSNGLVTGRSAGITEITATFDGMQATTTVRVSAPPLPGNPGSGTGSGPGTGEGPGQGSEPGTEGGAGSGTEPGSASGNGAAPGTGTGSGTGAETGPNAENPDPGSGNGGSHPETGHGTDNGGGSLTAPSFPDLDGHWAKDAVERGARAGLVHGYEDGTFKPDARVTRAEFVVMLARALHWPAAATPASPPAGEVWPAWAGQAIGRALADGIAVGYEDGTFRPNEPITRAEMTMLVYRALTADNRSLQPAKQPQRFLDEADVPPWAQEAFASFTAGGLLAGDELGRLRPADRTTRAEAVVLLLRLIERIEP